MELFKSVKGYEGIYMVSFTGHVYSILTGRILKPNNIKASDPKKNALQVKLYKRGKHKSFLISRLVAIAYLPNPKNLPEVNHIDGNRLNNWLFNLEWVTESENIIHAYRVLKRRHPSTGKFGINCQSKSRIRGVIRLDKLGNEDGRWLCIQDCARELNIPYKSLTKVIRGKRKALRGVKFQYA